MDPQSARVNFFIEKYSSLVKYAEGLAFPSYRRKSPSGADTWNWPKKVLFRLSHPFTIEDTGVWDSMGYLVLVFLMQMNIGWGLMLLAPALFRMPTLLSFSNLGAAISLIIAFAFAIPLAVVSYFWWSQLLASKEYRIIWRVTLVLMGGFLIWAFTQSIRNASITKQLIGSKSDILPFITSYIFFLIPALYRLTEIDLQ